MAYCSHCGKPLSEHAQCEPQASPSKKLTVGRFFQLVWLGLVMFALMIIVYGLVRNSNANSSGYHFSVNIKKSN